ncbi:tail fiber assembly [Yersinia phage phiR2-01]|uniref:Phage tail assembly chaperone gp38 n=1 Tax=Yersinia phage phiR2-01 TaxID=1206557 RepID=I7LEG3_9CAUD|nr:tail fiber assembly [Yersinia phage phiR2-01]CCI88552.1 phage tail assembly chaperone gp38 [Yersinia phage phiR2-01]
MIIYVWKGDYRSYGFSQDVWGGNVISVEVPDNFSGGNKTYNPESGAWITDPPYFRTHEDDVRDAERKRAELMQEAEQVMSEWKLDLALGLISEEDKQKLIAWRLYVKELDALELDAAPEIEWLQAPEV